MMIREHDKTKISDEQRKLVEDFEVYYNDLDHYLRKSLGTDKQVPFKYLVNEFSRKHPGWKDANLLITLAEIRNVIIHEKTERFRYVAIPTPPVVDELKACKERLMNPGYVIPIFKKDVKKLSLNDTLVKALKLIREYSFSQFPVYDGLKYVGLLTENGITHWLAFYISKEISLVDLDEVSIKDVLRNEEQRENCIFIPKDMRIDDLKALFSENNMLEAALITEHGKEIENLLGIATRWDIVHYIKE